MRSESPDITTPSLDAAPCFLEHPLTPVASTGAIIGTNLTLSQMPTITPSLSLQAGLDDLRNEPEDGPLFRATLAALERKTTNFRQKVKKVIKRATELHEQANVYADAHYCLSEAIKAIATSNPSAVKPALDNYFDVAFAKLDAFRTHDDVILRDLIIDPLRRIYDHDIKAAEGKKREFEEESRDYYAFLSRYLSKKNDSSEKKLMEKDSKYSNKRKNFELKRFDYYCYMQDLHGGRKEQEVLRQLTLFAEKQSDFLLATAAAINEIKPNLVALSQGVENARNDFKLLRTEREERRRIIEKTGPGKADAESVSASPALLERPMTSEKVERVRDPIPLVNPFVPTSSTFPDVGYSPEKRFSKATTREEQNRNESRRKEGLLWALSKVGGHTDPKVVQKLNWHKYWVVLAGGQLCEYQNWKQAIDLHNDPIDLRMATVREARNTERRFCFEVITPSLKRVYQATSEEELGSWMTHIQAAIESIIDGTGSVRSLEIQRVQNNNEVRERGGNMGQIFGKHASRRSALSAAISAASVASKPMDSGPTREEGTPSKGDALRLLNLVRDADPANIACADCSNTSKVEWCSINLVVIVCIECSGIHRGLGSHVSKIRSLTLDTTSFNPDLVDLFCRIGNRISNSFYEAILPHVNDATSLPLKPIATSPHESKVKYITAKYVDRAYVNYPSASPNDILLQSLSTNNVAAAVSALAARADPNVIHEQTQLPAFVLSLLSNTPPSSPSKETRQNDFKEEFNNTFPIAELLLQNGAGIPAKIYEADIQARLSQGAKSYIASKEKKSTSIPKSAGTTLYSERDNSANLGTLSRSLSNSNNAIANGAHKLQKRISSGSRMMKSPTTKE